MTVPETAAARRRETSRVTLTTVFVSVVAPFVIVSVSPTVMPVISEIANVVESTEIVAVRVPVSTPSETTFGAGAATFTWQVAFLHDFDAWDALSIPPSCSSHRNRIGLPFLAFLEITS